MEPTDSDIRKDLEVAKTAYERSHNYHNAVAIQTAENRLKLRADERRKQLRVVNGDAGSHDYSDMDIMGKALLEIRDTISKLKLESELPGVLMHCYNVSKHALNATKKIDE